MVIVGLPEFSVYNHFIRFQRKALMGFFVLQFFRYYEYNN